jgi:hypothetical protein
MKSKCLNAKTTSFHPSGLELDLIFELCHFSLFRALNLGFWICLGFRAWDLGFGVVR